MSSEKTNFISCPECNEKIPIYIPKDDLEDKATFPIGNIEGTRWVLLSRSLGDRKWLFRAHSISKPIKRKEKSDHRIWEVEGDRNVKCRPKAKISIKNYSNSN